MLEVWAKTHELVEDGTWTIEDYKTWQSLYPHSTEGTIKHPLSKALSNAMIMPKLPIENPLSPGKRKLKPKKTDSGESAKKE